MDWIRESWLKKPADMAALAIWPYLLGFAACALYYSRFRVLHLSGLRSQYVLVGGQVLLLAFFLPAAVFLLVRRLPFRRPAYWAFPVLFILDWLLLVLVDSPAALFKTCVLMALQLTLFVQKGFSFGVPPTVGLAKLLVLLALTSFYASFIFGLIPYYLGGGKPVQVLVSREGSLRAENLIFEDDDYFYFSSAGENLASGHGTTSTEYVEFITRVDKDRAKIVQYTIPSTFNLEAP